MPNSSQSTYRLLFGLILLALLPASIYSLQAIGGALFSVKPLAWRLGLGFAIGVILDQVLLRRIPGLETFEHELTHALAALMFFRRIRRFTVSRYQGGYVEYSGGPGGLPANDFIGLAPYVLPTFMVLSALLRPWLDLGVLPIFDIWIGFTFGYHTWSTFRETTGNWSAGMIRPAGAPGSIPSDIAMRGRLFSAVYITTVTSAIHGLIFAIILWGYTGAGTWWRLVERFLRFEWNWVQSLAHRINGVH